MSDPTEFFSQDFTNIEASQGLVGGDVVPSQYAKALLEDVTYRRSKSANAPGLNIRARLDEKFAKTPKRSFFYDLYLTGGLQAKVDGLTKTTGLGRTLGRFGDQAGPNDNRPQYASDAEIDAAGKQLAAALKGRSLIIRVDVESDEAKAKKENRQPYADKNSFGQMFEASEENLQVIVEAQFEPGNVKVKEEKKDGKTVRLWLEVRKAGSSPAKPSGGAPSVIG